VDRHGSDSDLISTSFTEGQPGFRASVPTLRVAHLPTRRITFGKPPRCQSFPVAGEPAKLLAIRYDGIFYIRNLVIKYTQFGTTRHPSLPFTTVNLQTVMALVTVTRRRGEVGRHLHGSFSCGGDGGTTFKVPTPPLQRGDAELTLLLSGQRYDGLWPCHTFAEFHIPDRVIEHLTNCSLCPLNWRRSARDLRSSRSMLNWRRSAGHLVSSRSFFLHSRGRCACWLRLQRLQVVIEGGPLDQEWKITL
jgi:hypothetical protein